MLSYSIEKKYLKERILATYFPDDIYLGLGNKLVNYSKEKILCIHEKSIRNISGNENFVGCCSYDGKATVFYKNSDLKETIEGPSTEIKGLAFYQNYLALTTRGKTTWILENFEISKILEDHTQDVKGCKFYKEGLYTWSYDNSVKIYQLFDLDHSWEMTQSIECEDIVWNVIFYNDNLCITLQNGEIVIFQKSGHQWSHVKNMKLSVSPIYSGEVLNNYLGIICNRNCLLILNSNFEKVLEIPCLNDDSDIFSISFNPSQNKLVCGSENGTLSIIDFF